jgi:hypothetical protein
LIKVDPAIAANFHKVLADHTAGDPMRLEVKWTNLSRRQIAKRLGDLGTLVSRDVVSHLPRTHGYRRRKALNKKTMGPRHPNRNAQFENIARLKKKYLKAGLPVISIDTKKKESLGNFYREGMIDTENTIRTLETVRHYISKTETTTGLTIKVRILEKVYQTGCKCAAGFKKTMKIVFDKVLPKWNYRTVSEPVLT